MTIRTNRIIQAALIIAQQCQRLVRQTVEFRSLHRSVGLPKGSGHRDAMLIEEHAADLQIGLIINRGQLRFMDIIKINF
ncbi:hypothetical protein SDC9_139271 [bioreactor metagenome]|uniref:Uncharacterized protein n=1 Tax=bioreactor metagenome TaxID=1076179 RepID=A0A645DS32_9ZZZZ